jgi:hypothetical protein
MSKDQSLVTTRRKVIPVKCASIAATNSGPYE